MTTASKYRSLFKSSLTRGEIIASISNGMAIVALYRYLTLPPTASVLMTVGLLTLAAIFVRLCAIQACVSRADRPEA